MSGGGFFAGSQGGSQGDSNKKSTDKAAIRPLTIRQITDAFQPHPDADFSVDDQDLTQISFVGKVLNSTRGTTNISYTIEDGTGQVDVRQWTESADDDTGMSDGIEQDTLVRVIGTIKTFSGKRHVTAAHIHPVKDFNEQQYHLLDAMYVHLQLTRGALPGQANGNVRAGATNGNTQANQQAGSTGIDARLRDFSVPDQRKIMSYIFKLGPQDTLPQEGISVHQIARGSGLSLDIVRVELDTLLSDGHVYSTVDEDHVLPTS